MNEFKAVEAIEFLDANITYATNEMNFECLSGVISEWIIEGDDIARVAHLLNIDTNPHLGTKKITRKGKEETRKLFPFDFSLSIKKYRGDFDKWDKIYARIDKSGLLTFRCEHEGVVFQYTYNGKFIVHWGEVEVSE